MRADVPLKARRVMIDRVEPVARLRLFRSTFVDMTPRFPTVELLIECEARNFGGRLELQAYSCGAGRVYCVTALLGSVSTKHDHDKCHGVSAE